MAHSPANSFIQGSTSHPIEVGPTHSTQSQASEAYDNYRPSTNRHRFQRHPRKRSGFWHRYARVKQVFFLIYGYLLLRLPSMYATRVQRVFRDAYVNWP